MLDWIAPEDAWIEDGAYHVRVENPDKGSPIKIVEVVVTNKFNGKYHAAVNHGFYILEYKWLNVEEQKQHYFLLTTDSHYQEIQLEIIDKSKGI